MAKIKCPNCGKKNPADSEFCMWCGASLIGDAGTGGYPDSYASGGYDAGSSYSDGSEYVDNNYDEGYDDGSGYSNGNDIPCPNCGKMIPADSSICAFCGLPINPGSVSDSSPVGSTMPQIQCLNPNCRQMIDADSNICPYCGTPVSGSAPTPVPMPTPTPSPSYSCMHCGTPVTEGTTVCPNCGENPFSDTSSASAPTITCVNCGLDTPADSNICVKCGHDPRVVFVETPVTPSEPPKPKAHCMHCHAEVSPTETKCPNCGKNPFLSLTNPDVKINETKPEPNETYKKYFGQAGDL